MTLSVESGAHSLAGISTKKLDTSIGRSGLRLASVEGPTEDKPGRQLLDSPKISLSAPIAKKDTEAFVARFPKVVERMLLVGGDQRPLNDQAYTDLLGKESAETNFLPIVAALSRPDVSSQAVIRVVHGASLDVPYRGISYPLPALVLAEQLMSENINVQVQVIYANHISGSLNDRDMEAARREGLLLAKAQKSFAEKIFPERVIDSLVFLEDRELSAVPQMNAELKRLALVMGEVLPDELKLKLKEKDSKHGGNGNHLDYSGAHLLVHNRGSMELFQPMFADQAAAVDPRIILNYGGGSEGDFYHARTIAAPFAGSEYQLLNLQYFSRHRFPAYFTNGGDISLRSVLAQGEMPVFDRKNPNFSRGAGADINYLRKVAQYRTGSDAVLQNFISEFREEVYA